MRISFVSGNREKLPDAVVPLGLLYVVASTPERHPRQIVDLCFEPKPVDVLAQRIAEFGPDLVAIAMRNIQNNDYSGTIDNIAYYRGLVDAVRCVSSAPIVVGGAGYSVMPAQILSAIGADYGISGEAEQAFPRLVDALESGGDLEAVPALHRPGPTGVLSNPPGPFLDLDAVPVPDRRLADPRYYERYRIESVQTKRGCPLRCDYCTYPLIEGRVGRVRSPVAVVDEMFEALERQPGIRHFFIVDSVFNLPKRHAKEVCRELIARDWDVPWTCYANPLGFDREFVELCLEARCAGMEIGSDSGCNEILERLRKGFTIDQIRALHRLCADVGIPDCHTFILGTPGETIDHVERTLDFLAELDPFSAILMIWVDDEEALHPELRIERARLRELIADRIVELQPAYPNWIVPPLGINFDAQLFRRIRRSGMHGPLWQHMRGSASSSGRAHSEPV